MRVQVKPGDLRETKWFEYVLRFVYGGLVTVGAALVGRAYGPVVGGLFLAFPSIFPASVSLVESHEAKKKQQDGKDGKQRAIKASGIDAAGAALGSFGLMAFGGIVWWLAPQLAPWLTLVAASLSWLVVATAAWAIRQRV